MPPAIAGGRHAHQPGILPVLHIAFENAVLDQHGARGGRAFIVDGERTAPPVDGAVIHHRHAGRRDALAQQSGEGAMVFLRLKSPSSPWPMASCSRMPGQPGPSTTVISPAGAGMEVEIDQRLAQRLVDRALPIVGIEIGLIAAAAAAAEAAGFLAAILFHHHRDVEPHQRTDVGIMSRRRRA